MPSDQVPFKFRMPRGCFWSAGLFDGGDAGIRGGGGAVAGVHSGLHACNTRTPHTGKHACNTRTPDGGTHAGNTRTPHGHARQCTTGRHMVRQA
eukprot:361710-Chlamydomonas_euryale.AAC.1